MPTNKNGSSKSNPSNKVNTRLDICIFNTRPYLYLCSYKKIIKTLSKYSLGFNELHNSHRLQEIFAYQYFKDTSIAHNQVYRFKDNNNNNLCFTHPVYKSDFSIFRLDVNNENIKKWFSDERLLKEAKIIYSQAVSLIKIYKKSFCYIGNVKAKEYNSIIYAGNDLSNINSISKFAHKYDELNEVIKIIKFRLNNYHKIKYLKNKDDDNDIMIRYNALSDLDKRYLLENEIVNTSKDKNVFLANKDVRIVFLEVLGYLASKIDDFLDVIAMASNYDFELLAYVGRAGTINLSFVKMNF